jgi:hypothetical protein
VKDANLTDNAGRRRSHDAGDLVVEAADAFAD